MRIEFEVSDTLRYFKFEELMFRLIEKKDDSQMMKSCASMVFRKAMIIFPELDTRPENEEIKVIKPQMRLVKSC